MTSTCRPTPSMCWQLWPSFNKIKKTAPNHRSRLICLQSQRPQWTWARLKVGRRHILLQTIIHSIRLKRSLDEFRGLFWWRDIWIEWTQTSLSHWKPILHTAASTATKEKIEHGDVFPQGGECRSTRARHSANPFHKERHPNAQEKTQTLTRFLTNYF